MANSYQTASLEKVSDDPPTFVLIRRGPLEVRKINAHLTKEENYWGTAQKRQLTACVLHDTQTGKSQTLFHGSFRPSNIAEYAPTIARFLGVSVNDLANYSVKHTLVFTE